LLNLVAKKSPLPYNPSHSRHQIKGDEAMTSQKTKTTLTPLGSRVLAKRLEQEEKLKGGIILPDSAKKKQETAQVIAVGPGSAGKDGKIEPIAVQVGDTILMDKYSGQEITLNDEEFVIVKSEDIIAVIN
jgi:chaperonin GroES